MAKRISRTGAARVALLAGLSAFSLLAMGSAAFAQAVPQNLAIAGVKLGMTVDQAKAALQAFSPDIKIVPLYGYWLGNNAVAQLGKIQDDPSNPNPPSLSTVTGLLAVALDEPIPAGSGAVQALSGDWFGLSFTPDANGGSLYAVVRTVHYANKDVSAGTSPTLASLTGQLAQMYGKPSATGNAGSLSGEHWVYDARGRLLTQGSREFSRCNVGVGSPQAYMIHGQLQDGSTTQYEVSDYTAAEVEKALTGFDGPSLTPENYFRFNTLFTNLEAFLPDITTFTEGADKSQFRKCGIELDANWEADDGTHLTQFTTFLADIGRTYFDNGLAKYFAPGAGTPAAAPKL